MGGRRGTLDTCLANVKCSGGGDLDKLLSGLKKRTQRGSPCPAVPSKKDQPVVGANGKSQDEAVSLEMKSDLSCADHLLHSGDKLHPHLTESTGRGPTLAAAVRKDEGLTPGPVEERLAGVYGAMKEALRRDWLEGGPRATDSHEGQYPKGELWVSGWPGHPKPWDVGFFKCELPSAFPELELSCLRSDLLWMPGDLPEVLLEDETRCFLLTLLKPLFSEQTIGCKKIVSSIKSTSNGLQIILGLLALPPLELANLSCHS